MTTGRKPPGYMTEDLHPVQTGGPAKYNSTTDKPVEHISLADEHGTVIGYIYANDADAAAGWVPRAAAGFLAQNLATPWMMMLRDAKARGIAPTAALDEMMTASPANKSKAVAGSRASSPSLDALKLHGETA